MKPYMILAQCWRCKWLFWFNGERHEVRHFCSSQCAEDTTTTEGNYVFDSSDFQE